MERHLATFQTVTAVLGVTALLAGFLASIGLRQLPELTPGSLVVLGPLLLAAGAVGGWATMARGAAIDRVRWEVVEDPLLTSGEREYAHKEAERERRMAGLVFFTAPIALSYWLAYHFSRESLLVAPPLLALFPLVGYLAGLGAAHWRARRRSGPSTRT